MKKLTFILTCVLLSSCAVQSSLQKPYSPFVEVYRGPWMPTGLPIHIIIRKDPNILEAYSPWAAESTFGRWEVRKDTLFFTPEYVVTVRKGSLRVGEVNDTSDLNLSYFTVPQQYLIKKDRLVDITDYGYWTEKWWPDWPDAPVPPGETYKRVEQVFRSKSLVW